MSKDMALIVFPVFIGALSYFLARFFYADVYSSWRQSRPENGNWIKFSFEAFRNPELQTSLPMALLYRFLILLGAAIYLLSVGLL